MATEATPSSRQARATRSAISPRLAIRTFSNTSLLDGLEVHQHLLELHPLSVLDHDLGHAARLVRGNLVHQLHRLDDAHRLPRADEVPQLGERLRAGLRG